MVTKRRYEGTELELFEGAVNWKAYWATRIAPFIRGAALEVGAGLGANLANLRELKDVRWTLLEPDPEQCEAMRRKVDSSQLPTGTEIVCGILSDLPANQLFDTILYIDVLEHIADDRGEIVTAAERLASGGRLIVLSPAYQAVFSPFDAAIGHYRRYDRQSLLALTPAALEPISTFYLDSLGLLLSLSNRYLAHQSSPTKTTIRVWDSCVIPLSRVTDRLMGFNVGRSIVGVWRKRAASKREPKDFF